MKRRIDACFTLAVFLVLTGCQTYQSPKPYGYFRIDLPSKSYTLVDSIPPFSFECPDYSILQNYSGTLLPQDSDEYWLNLVFPRFNGQINLTYKPVHSNLGQLIEDAHTFVGKHVVKADAITQTRYENPEASVYGILFDIKGNTASSVQFFVTDSVRNFIRGALYFNSEPNKDSLAPVIDFIRGDMIHLMESIHWKKKNP